MLYLWLAALACLASVSAQAAIPSFTFTFEKVQHPAFSARSVELHLTGAQMPHLEISLDELLVGERVWRNLRFSCDRLNLGHQSIDCDTGRLQLAGKHYPVSLQLFLRQKKLVLTVEPARREKWHLTVAWHPEGWQSSLRIVNGQGKRLAGLLPQLRQARINGTIGLSGGEASLTEWAAKLAITELSFSDAKGLRAGEDVHLQLEANAQRKQQGGWQWRGKLAWLAGGVFWQPFYFTGEGHRLAASGASNGQSLRIEQGSLTLSGIGQVAFSGEADLPTLALRQAQLQAESLEMAALFKSIIQPLAAETALAETEASGQAGFVWHYQDTGQQSLLLDLQDVTLNDERERFSFEGLFAHIPWQSDERSTGTIRLERGKILQIPLGSVQFPFETDGMHFGVPYVELPVLDGKVVVENFNASRQVTDWQWQFNGRLFPVSMEKLTEALQIQPMFGTLSGIIPQMNYAASVMTMEGVLVFNLFDGVVVARDLVLTEPLSRIPHLTMDMAMHHIDLDLLTRAYSFGRIQGRVDAEVSNLELVNWEPVRFDARLASSPGRYKRRISQAAIQNLTALGGASAMPAIQRRFLSFFEQFRYAEIGWRCRLRGSVCQMGGVEPSSNNERGYVLVKGSGVPAITITGYNRKVDWPELIKRLEHAIKSGSPIIH
ncbi:hypothetical protein [Nitrosomonas sp. ANs5]|uniref:hypothetical protein n=1 Tax=Nitrosomonas sp. ANs5 TaxID=3423941 RepID=UPI003D3377F2